MLLWKLPLQWISIWYMHAWKFLFLLFCLLVLELLWIFLSINSGYTQILKKITQILKKYPKFSKNLGVGGQTGGRFSVAFSTLLLQSAPVINRGRIWPHPAAFCESGHLKPGPFALAMMAHRSALVALSAARPNCFGH